MRESRSKSRNRQTTPSPEDNSATLSIGLELNALKIKNAELTKVNIKLKQDCAEVRNQLANIHAENVYICTKYNNIKMVMKRLQDKSKMCMPAFLDFLNLILQVSDENKMMSSASGSKDSLANSPAKTTQTVKPHTVNGTVLHRPTISLTRLGVIENANLPSTSNSENNRGNSPNLIVSRGRIVDEDRSPANGEQDRIVENGHFVNGNDEESFNETEVDEEEEPQAEERSFISRRTSKKKTRSMQEELNDSFDEENEQEEDEVEQEDDDVEEPEHNEPEARLSTICEENEITIILPRLSEAEMATASSQIVRTSFNDSSCSTEPQANDSYFNMSVNEESLRASKRLRVDVTVFEPRGNSTRFDAAMATATPSPSAPSPRKRGVTLTETSCLEVTPTAGYLQPDGTWMVNTPSASAMGDGTTSSKLSILEGFSPSATAMGDCTDSTKLSVLKGADKESGQSLSSPRTSTPRTRSSRISNRSARTTAISPPLKKVSSKRRRGGSSENLIKSPMVLLERLEKVNSRRSSEMNAHVLGSILNTSVTKKSSEIKPPRKTGRTKKSTLRKNSDTEESQEENEKDSWQNENVNRESNISLNDKIKEVQRRLSSYNTTESSETTTQVSPSKRSRGRPTRAAKPKDLKDASLKVKMRRM